VRQAVTTRETTHERGGKFDWSKTWVAEMMLSESEREKRKEELERQRGITPESRSQKEIKAGVITTSVGVALAIFLFVFMQGIIIGARLDADTAAILSRLWIVGVIPFFVGLGLMINGLFVKNTGQAQTKPDTLERAAQPQSLPGDSSAFTPSPSSVTEHTTRELRASDREPDGR
jgi:hypothetical protein